MTFDEIFQYLESPPTIYAKEIFVLVDAVDTDGMVQFGRHRQSSWSLLLVWQCRSTEVRNGGCVMMNNHLTLMHFSFI